MGPSTNVDGEGSSEASVGASIAKLQWGRRRTSTESLMAYDRSTMFRDASMGPSTNVDGEDNFGGGQNYGPARFNGAVDERRRREARRCPASGWSRCFNGAVDERRRRGPGESVASERD